MNIASLSSSLQLKDGIYYSEKVSDISYPAEDNQTCMQIEDSSFWFLHRNRCIAALVKSFGNHRVFWDIGGGNGFVSAGLQEQGVETVLLEPGPHGALNGKKRGIRNVICSTLQDSGLKAGTIASAGMFDVIEHIENDVDFLKTVHQFMQDDGIIYLTVPALPFLWSREDEYSGHFRRYTLNSLKRTLEQSGFEMMYSSYFFSVLTLPVFLFRTLPFLFRLKTKFTEPEKFKKEHSAGSSSKSFLNRIFNWELSRIRSCKRMAIGSSCLAVARKRKNEGFSTSLS